MTGRDFVSASLRLIGVLAPGESLESQEATDGLSSLNRMLGSWSTEELVINATTRESFTLTPGTQQYTMGSSGTFNTTRPLNIVRAALRDETQTPAAEYPINILTLAEWQRIIVKAQSSEVVTDLYAEGTYPLETINIYPKPTIAYKLVLWSDKPLTEISTLDTVLAFPPGYERALIYNGAIELAPEYGRTVSAEVAKVADESKANLKRLNHRPRLLRVDDALRSGSGFNIFTGGSR